MCTVTLCLLQTDDSRSCCATPMVPTRAPTSSGATSTSSRTSAGAITYPKDRWSSGPESNESLPVTERPYMLSPPIIPVQQSQGNVRAMDSGSARPDPLL